MSAARPKALSRSPTMIAQGVSIRSKCLATHIGPISRRWGRCAGGVCVWDKLLRGWNKTRDGIDKTRRDFRAKLTCTMGVSEGTENNNTPSQTKTHGGGGGGTPPVLQKGSAPQEPVGNGRGLTTEREKLFEKGVVVSLVVVPATRQREPQSRAVTLCACACM